MRVKLGKRVLVVMRCYLSSHATVLAIAVTALAYPAFIRDAQFLQQLLLVGFLLTVIPAVIFSVAMVATARFFNGRRFWRLWSCLSGMVLGALTFMVSAPHILYFSPPSWPAAYYIRPMVEFPALFIAAILGGLVGSLTANAHEGRSEVNDRDRALYYIKSR